MKKLLHETRSETIARHTDAMFRATRMDPQQFSVGLIREYHAAVAPEARTVSFHVDGPTDKVLKANGQMVDRFRAQYAENAMRFPADLEEAWVLAMREPFRTALRSDLARRGGLLLALLPDLLGESDTESVSRVTHEFAEALMAMAPTMADKVIDQRDRPLIPAAIQALDELIGAITSLRARYAVQLAAEDHPSA